MINNTRLRNRATFDIITMMTIWGLINFQYLNYQYGNYYIDLRYRNNNVRINFMPFYSVCLGFGYSLAILKKYC